MNLNFMKNASGPKRILLYTIPASALILLVCLVSLLFVQLFGGNTAIGPSTDPDNNTSGGSKIVYTSLPVSSGDIYKKGTLLVVNTETKIQIYPDEAALLKISENKTASYQISTNMLRLDRKALEELNAMLDAYFLNTNDASLLITSAYRTEAEQAALTSSSVQAGYSDHHLALSVRIRSKINTTVSSLVNSHWIYQNCHEYGFIQRYPEGKEALTFDDQQYVDCFRYVSVPHATYMYENDLCLEEYVALLKGYTYDGTHLSVTAGGTEYEIYYVPATNPTDANAVTQLPVPENAEYSYSGNNTDGFIVTITKSAS